MTTLQEGPDTQDEPGDHDRFGCSLVSSYINLDGITNAGGVNVFYGSVIGLDTPNNQFFWDTSSNGGTRFGSTLASGLFNGDGYWDPAIGAPGKLC